MLSFFSAELEYLIRLLLSAICGAVVGLEREKRQKSAGLRTHIIVAVASTTMMIVGKYGFFDVVQMEGISLDASRIAAGVVTAIGFLGAGVIFIRGESAVGLTTAAGLWATVGIGICMGAGMYVVGIFTTILMVIIQLVMHWKKIRVVTTAAGNITVNLTKHDISFDQLKNEFEKHGIFIRNIRFTYTAERNLILSCSVILGRNEPIVNLLNDIEINKYIDSMEMYTLN